MLDSKTRSQKSFPRDQYVTELTNSLNSIESTLEEHAEKDMIDLEERRQKAADDVAAFKLTIAGRYNEITLLEEDLKTAGWLQRSRIRRSITILVSDMATSRKLQKEAEDKLANTTCAYRSYSPARAYPELHAEKMRLLKQLAKA